MKLFLTFFLIFLTSISLFAQNSPKDEWVRVQSDNGEFSIEIPVKHKLIFDKDGFQVSNTSAQNFSLKNVYLLNAYIGKTSLSFEIYEANRSALDSIYEREKGMASYFKQQKTADFSEKKFDNNKIRELIIKRNDSFIIRRYFGSKKFIYILTAVTRNGDNEITKRYFDSMMFDSNLVQPTLAPNGGTSLSTLKTSTLELITKDVQSFNPNENNPPIESDTKPLVIAWKPAPSYLDSARKKSIQGTMQLRCTFTEDGFISKIEFINLLPEGLSRQVLFAALRVKFLPKEKNENPIISKRVLEYNFAIY